MIKKENTEQKNDIFENLENIIINEMMLILLNNIKKLYVNQVMKFQ